MSKTDLTDKNVINVDFLSNFKNDYYDYGMDVIKNRALPDAKRWIKARSTGYFNRNAN